MEVGKVMRFSVKLSSNTCLCFPQRESPPFFPIPSLKLPLCVINKKFYTVTFFTYPPILVFLFLRTIYQLAYLGGKQHFQLHQ